MFGSLGGGTSSSTGNTGFGTRLAERNSEQVDSIIRSGAFGPGTSQNTSGFGAFGGAKPATGFGAFGGGGGGGGGNTFGGSAFGQPSTSQTGTSGAGIFGQPSTTGAFGSGGGIFGSKPASMFGSTTGKNIGSISFKR